MDNIQFYQPSKVAGIRKDEQPTVSNLRLFTALRPSKKGKKTHLNLDQIENLDMTGLSLKKFLNPFHVSASNLSGIKADAGSMVFLPYYLSKQKLTLPGILNGLITHNHNLSSFI